MTVILPMVAADAIAIQRQSSQAVQLGIARVMTIEEARDLAEAPGEAWTAKVHDRIVACFGLRETFPGMQAVAWAILSNDVGRSHLRITRFARRRIVTSSLRRIEAIVKADAPAEGTWASLVGLAPAHVLRCFGAAAETHVLHERIREG